MNHHASRKNVIGLALYLLAASGCTKTFAIHPVPPPSANHYATASKPQPTTFTITDARGGTPLNTGTLNVELEGMNDEIAYLGQNLASVLRAQGIDVNYTPSGNADLTLKVLTYRIRNLRTSGFSPYHTFTSFSADLVVADAPPQRVTSYFKNSKTPVWTFSEVERPCYQIPTEVVVQEVAAKMNAHAFGRIASSETVEKITASIPQTDADSASEQYLKVLALGYTNNPAATAPLVQLTHREEVLMRASAVSALGTLGAKDQLTLLKAIYTDNSDISKAMALKSIGDLGTPESTEFLRAVKQSEDYQDDDSVREVVDLYL